MFLELQVFNEPGCWPRGTLIVSTAGAISTRLQQRGQ